MSIYQIIKQCQAEQGSNAKQAILEANKDNHFLMVFMRLVNDPSLSYYQSNLPKVKTAGDRELDVQIVSDICIELSLRKVTGKAAIKYLSDMLASMTPESQELMAMLIKRSVGAGIGDSMILKTWPGLYFIPPYQRCSLWDETTAKIFNGGDVFVQHKLDGSFMYLVQESQQPPKGITRQGSYYPTDFVAKLAEGLLPDGAVYVGELEVYKDNLLLNRQTGNGILNSILQGDTTDYTEETGYSVCLTVWDMLSIDEFEAGKSTRKYSERLEFMHRCIPLAGNLKPIATLKVSTVEAAFDVYSKVTEKGLEGVILKSPDSLWKNGTAKDVIKLKIKFEAEFKCTGIYEGKPGSKYEGMMGGINYATEDAELMGDCGTGFSDKHRKDFFDNPELIIGKVVTLSANDIIQSRDIRKKPSLSLPAFEEVRNDKTVANTLPEVEAALKAAKSGTK